MGIFLSFISVVFYKFTLPRESFIGPSILSPRLLGENKSCFTKPESDFEFNLEPALAFSGSDPNYDRPTEQEFLDRTRS